MTDTLIIEEDEAPNVVPNHKATKERPRIFERSERKSNPAGPRTIKARDSIPNKPGQFVEPLQKMYAGLAFTLMPFDQEAAMVIMDNAEKCAVSLDEAAQKNESLRRILKSMTSVGVWGAVIAAHAPIAMVLLKNHTPLFSAMEDKGLFTPRAEDKD